MSDDVARVIGTWEVRAGAYLELTRRYPIFERMAARLVATLPPDFAGTACDVGAGWGLVSALLLAARPGARAVLVEPAARMRALAGEALAPFAGRFEIVDGDAARLPGGPYAGALSSAVMHLVDEDSALPAVAAALSPGASFVFNLWGHSFDEIAGDPDPPWKALLDQAIAALGYFPRPPEKPGAVVQRPRTREGLAASGERAGFELASIDIDHDEVPLVFFMDFAMMSPAFLPRVRGVHRASLIARARSLSAQIVPVRTARVVLRRT